MFGNNKWGMNYGRKGYGCGCEQQVITEPVITNCIEKEFVHEIPHVCPIHTHVINRHIYNHTYTPQYTCSEEDQIINNDNGNCCGFR